MPIAAQEDNYALNFVLAYQDRTTQEWAAEIYGRVANLIGKESIRVTSWQISNLVRPGFIADAVRAAALADVIVIAVPAAERLPIDLCVWIGAWVSRRARRPGALVALIGLTRRPDLQAFSTQDFLRMVARKGGLDFFPQERVLPGASHRFLRPGDNQIPGRRQGASARMNYWW